MLTNRRWAPVDSSNCPAKPGCRRSTLSISSRSVVPSAATIRSPPTVGRSMAGTRTLAICRSAQRRYRGATERLVVDELRNGGVIAAERAVRIARDLHLAELHAQAVEQQQPIDQRIAE